MSLDNDVNALVNAICAERSVVLVDDVAESGEGFTGSFLWHGLPLLPETLDLFSRKAQKELLSERRIDAVVGIVSSGISWATALALSMQLPLATLRLEPHRYGPHNPAVTALNGRRIILVDNFIGSGDSLRMALMLLKNTGVVVSAVFVAESYSEQLHSLIDSEIPVAAMLNTREKLYGLLERGYFNELGADVAGRFLEDRESWLSDTNWCQKVKARLANGTENGLRSS